MLLISPSPIGNALNRTAKTYKAWKRTCGRHADLTTQLWILRATLNRAFLEAKSPGSLYVMTQRDLDDWHELLNCCERTSKTLTKVIKQYTGVISDHNRCENWERISLSTPNLYSLGESIKHYNTSTLEFLNFTAIGGTVDTQSRLDDMSIVHEIVQQMPDVHQLFDMISTSRQSDAENLVIRKFARNLRSEGFAGRTVSYYTEKLADYLNGLTGVSESDLLESYDNGTCDEKIRRLEFKKLPDSELNSRFTLDRTAGEHTTQLWVVNRRSPCLSFTNDKFVPGFEDVHCDGKCVCMPPWPFVMEESDRFRYGQVWFCSPKEKDLRAKVGYARLGYPRKSQHSRHRHQAGSVTLQNTLKELRDARHQKQVAEDLAKDTEGSSKQGLSPNTSDDCAVYTTSTDNLYTTSTDSGYSTSPHSEYNSP